MQKGDVHKNCKGETAQEQMEVLGCNTKNKVNATLKAIHQQKDDKDKNNNKTGFAGEKAAET